MRAKARPAAQAATRARHQTPTTAIALLGVAVLIVTAGLLAYANSFQGAFVLDDRSGIVTNPALQTLRPPWKALWSPKNSTLAGRPVVSLTMAINHALGRRALSDVGALQDRAWMSLNDRQALLAQGFHLVNLLIHLLAALTLFGLVRRTLRTRPLAEPFGAASLPLAAAVALLWTVHPLHVVSVTYLSQRTESLMGLFYLLTLYCALRSADAARRRVWMVSSVMACLLGMGCKEVMVSAPLIVLLYDRTFLAGSFRDALRVRRGLYLGLASTWIALLALTVPGQRDASAGFHRPELSVLGYVKFQFIAIVTYLRQAFWPDKLIFDYGEGPVPVFSQYALPMAIVILIVLAVMLALFKRPALGFLGACLLLILVPSSSFLPIVTERISYHRMYLPLAAVAALVVCAAFLLGRRVLAKQVRRGRTRMALGWVLASVLALVAGVGLGRSTCEFNGIFVREAAVWADVLAKMPENERAQNNYGASLMDDGYLDEAIPFFNRAIALKPDYADPWNNLGVAALRRGKAEQAVPCFAEAIRLGEEHTAADMNMGDALMTVGRSAEAASHYESALRTHQDVPHVMSRLAWILATHPDERVRDGKRAVEVAERLCAAVPNNPGHLNTLAAAYAEAGDWPAAMNAGEKAIGACRQMLDTLPLAHRGRRELTDAMGVMQSNLLSYRDRQAVRDTSL